MLPPGAIKDAEGVGECSQVFFVSECQDGAGEHRHHLLSAVKNERTSI